MTGGAKGWGDEPSILIFADSDGASADALIAAHGVGARILGVAPIAGAVERLKGQGAVDIVMIELDGSGSAERELLLAWADRASRSGATAVLISLPHAMLDDVFAGIEDSRVEMLVDPTVEQRSVALGALLASRRNALREDGPGGDAARLKLLSEDATRLASALAELSRTVRAARVAVADAAPDTPLDASPVRNLIRLRRLRDQFFSRDLFADPAWDMLLDLMAARLEQGHVAVSSLCIAAAVPPTTALRWIRTLTEHGLFVRSADPGDGRRIFIELSDDAFAAMAAYFRTLQQVGVRLG